jgi:DNA-binding NtrC family response regulator
LTILVLDDDATLRGELATFLGLHGHLAIPAADLAGARAALAATMPRIDLILADLYLGAERGTDLLGAVGDLPLIVISGAGGVREAVEALRRGAWDFLEKPIEPDRLLGHLRNLAKGLETARRIEALGAAWLAERAAYAPGSPFETALLRAKEAAATPLSVLVTGPSGSGKDVVARWIHASSPRSAGPFVAINCAAIPPDLAESSFFGAARGAYTGADRERQGWFQAADGGTVFLDEIGDIPLPVQAKLLRAAESGEVQRLGSTVTERVDVRIVSATNRDLAARAALGLFREDLFWRLAQTRIALPPLAERRADILPLAAFFLERLGGGALGTAPRLDEEAKAYLEARAWPGNVRELRAFVERAAWRAEDGLIRGAALTALEAAPGEAFARGAGLTRGASAEASRSASVSQSAPNGPLLPLKEARLAFERNYIARALAESAGSVAGAARALGMLPNNLSRRLRELGMGTEEQR